MRAISLLAALALTGCVAAPSSVAPGFPPRQPVAVSIKSACITVRTYSDAEGRALAEFVSGLDPASIAIVALADYARMRADARACVAKG